MGDEADRALMARALALAAKGLYTTSPNPRVGCVVARGEKVLGEGWHVRAGLPHAERLALDDARANGHDVRGATVYVTLEPCNHTGRTPPCVDALIDAKVGRVVAAMADPNPVAAGGSARLRAAGIAVETGLLGDAAQELNPGFVSRMTRGRPWVRVKIAASLDGRSAIANGQSRWITGPEARADGHAWRARACAILTGIGTVRADNPQLTVRDVETPRQPLRVVVDSRLEMSPSARVLPALVFSGQPGTLAKAEVLALPNANGKVDLPRMLEALAGRGVNELHVEAGFRLNGSLVREGCVDEFLLYLNPSFLGDAAQGMLDLPATKTLDARLRLRVVSFDRLGDDLRLLARPAAA